MSVKCSRSYTVEGNHLMKGAYCSDRTSDGRSEVPLQQNGDVVVADSWCIRLGANRCTSDSNGGCNSSNGGCNSG